MKEKFQTRIKCEFTQTMMVFNTRFSSLSIFEKKYNIAQRGNTHRYTSPTAITANYWRCFFVFSFAHILKEAGISRDEKRNLGDFTGQKKLRDPAITGRNPYWRRKTTAILRIIYIIIIIIIIMVIFKCYFSGELIALS